MARNPANKKEVIRLGKGLYTLKAIEQAINAFAEICSIEKKEDAKDYIIVMSIKEKQDLTIMRSEFCNFALGILKEETTG